MTDALAAAYGAHARSLWALCYRMTGVAADADELVQETFVRALASRPDDGTDAPLRPWLFSVATRLCIDRLRRRRTEGYCGPWLPSPVPDEDLLAEAPASARYELAESASMAFLLALEALSPGQRAALVLGDVFDLTAREIAVHLETTEANVRQLQRRGRRALAARAHARTPLDPGRSRAALEGFLQALAVGDPEAARRFLADDVVVLNDGAGVYHAARVPLHGPARAVSFLTRLLALRGMPTWAMGGAYNGLWAVDMDFAVRTPGDPPRGVTGALLDADGRIAVIYSVVAPGKLVPRKTWDG